MKSYLEILKWTSTMWHGPKAKLRVPVLPPGWVFHCVSVQIAGDSRVFPGSADVLFWCYVRQKWRLTGEGGLLTGLQNAGRERGKERRRKNEGGKKEHPPTHTHIHPSLPHLGENTWESSLASGCYGGKVGRRRDKMPSRTLLIGKSCFQMQRLSVVCSQHCLNCAWQNSFMRTLSSWYLSKFGDEAHCLRWYGAVWKNKI